jgi:hypothetical protein
VAASEGRAPNHDSRAVGLAAAGAQVTEVERKRRDAGVGELLAESVEAPVAGPLFCDDFIFGSLWPGAVWCLVPSEAPEDDRPSKSSWRDPALFEARETELIKRLNEVIQSGIPADATVREAMLEMRRAAEEEPEAKALRTQLMALALVGGGKVMQEWAEGAKDWRSLGEPE